MERSTVARGNNYGSRIWSGETIGGAVFGPAGSLAARRTYGMTGPLVHEYNTHSTIQNKIMNKHYTITNKQMLYKTNTIQ